jgi:hypothetical protein
VFAQPEHLLCGNRGRGQIAVLGCQPSEPLKCPEPEHGGLGTAIERSLQRICSFGESSLCHPEWSHADDEAELDIGWLGPAPRQRGAQVVELGRDLLHLGVEPPCLGRPAIRHGEGQEVLCMPALECRLLACLLEPLQAVLPRRLQQPVPAAHFPLDYYEGLVDQPEQQIGHAGISVNAAHGLG